MNHMTGGDEVTLRGSSAQGLGTEGHSVSFRSCPRVRGVLTETLLSRFLNGCSIILELSKARISALATVSAAAGFVLASGKVSFDIVIPMVGIFMLASGAAALNHYLEREQDALMGRTRLRPLPARRVSTHNVLFMSLAAMTVGFAVFLWGINAQAAGLGVFAAVWYDGVYTYLKKKTPYAVIPGSLVGSVPPIIGWIAGGGAASAPGLCALALFFFIWQVPHFWLLLIIHKDDYDRGGFPTLEAVIPDGQLQRITFFWIAAASTAGVMLSLCLSVCFWVTPLTLLAAAGWLVWESAPLMGPHETVRTFQQAFRWINIYILFVISALSLDRIIFSLT